MRRVLLSLATMLLAGGCEDAPNRSPEAPSLNDARSSSTAATPPAAPMRAGPELERATEGTRPLIAIELDPRRGALGEQLTLHAARAHRAGLRPFVELHAGWCAICRRVDRELSRSETEARLRGVYLIRVDTDAWAEELRPTGLTSPTIPAFYALDHRGRPGPDLHGHRWTPATDVITRLEAFMASPPPGS